MEHEQTISVIYIQIRHERIKPACVQGKHVIVLVKRDSFLYFLHVNTARKSKSIFYWLIKFHIFLIKIRIKEHNKEQNMREEVLKIETFVTKEKAKGKTQN